MKKFSYKARVITAAYVIAIPISIVMAGFILGWW